MVDLGIEQNRNGFLEPVQGSRRIQNPSGLNRGYTSQTRVNQNGSSLSGRCPDRALADISIEFGGYPAKASDDPAILSRIGSDATVPWR